MADNGTMAHNPPLGLGMTEMIFRGGKGDFLEGGVRVPAFAWWPGVIDGGQIIGDIIHQTDLFTTFARIAGATEYVPTDRIIDGIDQTALLLNGDTQGRRDYVFIYTGPMLGATVKGRMKRHWISGDPGDVSGVAAAYYDLLTDTRENNPLMANVFHFLDQARLDQVDMMLREGCLLQGHFHPNINPVVASCIEIDEQPCIIYSHANQGNLKKFLQRCKISDMGSHQVGFGVSLDVFCSLFSVALSLSFRGEM